MVSLSEQFSQTMKKSRIRVDISGGPDIDEVFGGKDVTSECTIRFKKSMVQVSGDYNLENEPCVRPVPRWITMN